MVILTMLRILSQFDIQNNLRTPRPFVSHDGKLRNYDKEKNTLKFQIYVNYYPFIFRINSPLWSLSTAYNFSFEDLVLYQAIVIFFSSRHFFSWKCFHFSIGRKSL